MWRSPRILGVLCVVAATLLLIGSDASIKYLSGDYPLHEIVFARTLVALPVTLAIALFDGGLKGLGTRRPGLQIVRGMLVVGANATYFLALAAMPLADAMAIFFVAPLFITMLSALFLREPVGMRRWTGVAIGLCGMLVMVGPERGDLKLVALLPMAAALCYASMQMLTRVMAATESATAMAFYIQLCFLFTTIAFGVLIGDGRHAGGGDPSLEFLLRAWSAPVFDDLLLMALSGVCMGLGAYLLSQGYRLAQASLVAPFEYTALPWGVAVGFIVWGDLPSPVAALGIALIVGGGLYVLRREGRRPRVRGERVAR